MIKSAREPVAKDFTNLAAAFFLILCYPFFGMLWYHSYPVFSAEVALILLVMFVLSVLFALALRSVRPLVLNLVLATLMTLSFTVHFNPLFFGILSIIAVSLLSAQVLGRHFPAALTVVMGMLIIGAFLDNRLDRPGNFPDQAHGTSAKGGGPLIHILTDGFIGPDGLPGPEESDNLRADMLSFFKRHGFRLHTRAYSHYASTLDSMTRAFNFRNDAENLFKRSTLLGEPLTVTENAWFSTLRDMGYPVIVYQTEGVDFCNTGDDAVTQCNVFRIPNLKTIHEGIEAVSKRSVILLQTLLRQSRLLNERLMRHIPKFGVSTFDEQMLMQLKANVVSMPDKAYFVHLILPHLPLVYRPDCSLDYVAESWKHFTVFDGVIGNSEATQRVRYKRYAANAKCALSQLDSLFVTLKNADLYERATIIVHGDHGGPLFRFGPYTVSHNQLTLRDLRETFSILYAVKRPGGQFSLEEQTASLNVLLAQTLLEISGLSRQQLGLSIVEEDQPFIYLTDTDPLKRINVDIFGEE